MAADLERIAKVALAQGMTVERLTWSKKAIRIKKGNLVRYFYGPYVPLNSAVAVALAKHKSLTKQIFAKIGISTPIGFLCEDASEAIRRVEREKEVKYPLVVKPNDSGLGEGVTVGVRNKEELTWAIKTAQEGYKKFIVEEFASGDDYRLLVLDGELIAACKRIPPFVVGDGKSSLKELVDQFNIKRAKKLVIDREVERNLKEQKVNFESKVASGRRIQLRRNANVHTGGISEDVTDKVASKFKEIAVRITKELELRLSGVDIITSDISEETASYNMIEVNGMPSYDIHEEPSLGKPRPYITRLILEAVFKES